MFTVKHIYTNGENYHAWSAVSYYVDRTPPTIDTEGSSDGRADSRQQVHVNAPTDIVSPRVTLELANGSELIFDVVGELYIENSAGKTIDVVRPRLERRTANA